MDDDIGDVILLMPTRLRRVEAGGVVFIHADLQIVGIVLAEFMRGRDDLACSPRDIVVKVVRDDGATGDEVIVPIQDQAGPRKFVGGGLASLKVIGVVEFPLSASLFRISSVVVVAVGIATSTSGGAESQLVADEAESDVVTSTTASAGGARDLSPLFASGNGLTLVWVDAVSIVVAASDGSSSAFVLRVSGSIVDNSRYNSYSPSIIVVIFSSPSSGTSIAGGGAAAISVLAAV